MKAKKKGSTGLMICSGLALLMLAFSAFTTGRYFSCVPLGTAMYGTPVFFSPFRFVLSILFAASIFIIGRKNESKGVVIAFSAVNIIIALIAFIPSGRFYTSTLLIGRLFHYDAVTGMFCLMPFVFYALILLFSVMTMLAALKKKRTQPKPLCNLILAALVVYGLYSFGSILFTNPYLTIRTNFSGFQYMRRAFAQLAHGKFGMDFLLGLWRQTAHMLYPFATVPVLLSMFFAARSIGPMEKPKAAVFPEHDAPAAQMEYSDPGARPDYVPQAVSPAKPADGAHRPNYDLMKLDKMRADGLITYDEYYSLRKHLENEAYGE